MRTVFVALAALALAGCETGKVVATSSIPDLPKIDPALKVPAANPHCTCPKARKAKVFDAEQCKKEAAVTAIPVERAVEERDCFAQVAKDRGDQINALIKSDDDREAAIDKLREGQKTKVGKD